MWGNKKTMNWGDDPLQGKKIKLSTGEQQLFKNGNWGNGYNPNLGLTGYRGTQQENAELGKKLGKQKLNRG